MIPSIKAEQLIKKFEGLRLKPYICCAGFATIGYGHRLASGENSAPILEQEAESLLQKDMLRVGLALKRNISFNLTQNQFDALVSFTYNVGSAALQRSLLRQKLNNGQLEEVAPEMLKWVYAKARIVKGLVLRRKAEIELFYS